MAGLCKGIQRQIAELSLRRDNGTEPECEQAVENTVYLPAI